MNKSIFETIKNSTKTQNAILVIVLVVFAAISLINYQSISSIKDNEKVVIVPLNQTSPFWVSNDSLDNEYLSNMGYYIADLWQSVTPANIENRYARLLSLAHPVHYAKIKSDLQNYVNLVKRYSKNSYLADITKLSIDERAQNIIINVQVSRYTNKKKEEVQSYRLTIGYAVESAQFFITSLIKEQR